MTEKRFRSGFAKYDEFSDEIIDELTGKHYFDSTKDDYVFSKEIVDLLNELDEEKQQLKKENESLKQTIETQIFNYNNAKSIIHSSEKQIWRLEDRNEQLKKGMIEVVDRYIRNVEHNPPSSTKTYLKVKGALDNVREGLRDLLEDLE